MNRVFRAKGVLVADGVGCAIAGSAVLGSDLVASAIDPSLKSRPIIGTALGATSVTLFAAAVRSRDSDLSLAAAVNLGWVGVCLIALSRRPSRLGVALVAATAAFDSVADCPMASPGRDGGSGAFRPFLESNYLIVQTVLAAGRGRAWRSPTSIPAQAC